MSTSDVSITEKSNKITEKTVPLVYVRKTKKQIISKEPKWLTFSKILGPNLLLFILLIGISQIIRTIVNNRGNEGFIRTGSDIETRVTEIETFLTKTTKFIENEVKKVDRRVENELKGVKMDLSKNFDVKNDELVKKMKNFDKSLELLEGVYKNLKVEEFVKRDDLEGVFEEFKKNKGTNSDKKFNDFDLVLNEVKKMVDIELEKHVNDGLGRVDYAVASGGGKVVKHSENFGSENVFGWLKKVQNYGVSETSVKIISPSFGEAGECFAMNGSSGFVDIRLRSAIVPEAVTLEHVSKAVAFDRTSAPKDCQISGWLQKRASTEDPVVDDNKTTFLTEFTYDLENSNVQTFDVLDTPVVIDTIRLSFTSNHGNPTYTCIYRLRVHGREPDSDSM